MSHDEIIRMAREAGFELADNATDEAVNRFSAFSALVAAAEREACALVCDEQTQRSELSMFKAKGAKARDVYSAACQTSAWNAQAIRARSKP